MFFREMINYIVEENLFVDKKARHVRAITQMVEQRIPKGKSNWRVKARKTIALLAFMFDVDGNQVEDARVLRDATANILSITDIAKYMSKQVSDTRAYVRSAIANKGNILSNFRAALESNPENGLLTLDSLVDQVDNTQEEVPLNVTLRSPSLFHVDPNTVSELSELHVQYATMLKDGEICGRHLFHFKDNRKKVTPVDVAMAVFLIGQNFQSPTEVLIYLACILQSPTRQPSTKGVKNVLSDDFDTPEKVKTAFLKVVEKVQYDTTFRREVALTHAHLIHCTR